MEELVVSMLIQRYNYIRSKEEQVTKALSGNSTSGNSTVPEICLSEDFVFPWIPFGAVCTENEQPSLSVSEARNLSIKVASVHILVHYLTDYLGFLVLCWISSISSSVKITLAIALQVIALLLTVRCFWISSGITNEVVFNLYRGNARD